MGVEERRRALIELGKKLFAEHAYDQLSTDELARLAGVSKGLLYHYFPSKRDYYVATIREVARQVTDDTAPDPSLPMMDALRRSLGNFILFVENHPQLYRALVRGGIGADTEVHAVLDGFRKTSCDRIFSLLGIATPSPRLALAVVGWIGFVEFACLHWAEHRPFDHDQLIDMLVGAADIPLREANR